MTEWKPIDTRPTAKEIAGRGYLITWYDARTDERGRHGWWNMNSGNIMYFREQPTHWAPVPSLPSTPNVG